MSHLRLRLLVLGMQRVPEGRQKDTKDRFCLISKFYLSLTLYPKKGKEILFILYAMASCFQNLGLRFVLSVLWVTCVIMVKVGIGIQTGELIACLFLYIQTSDPQVSELSHYQLRVAFGAHILTPLFPHSFNGIIDWKVRERDHLVQPSHFTDGESEAQRS